MAPATTSTAGTIVAHRHLKGGPTVRSDIAPGGILPAWDAGNWAPFHGWNKRARPD